MACTKDQERTIVPTPRTRLQGADAAWPIGELAAQLPRLLDGCATVHLPFAAYEALDRQVFAAIDHQAAEESFLVQIHDRPLQERLRYYEERPRCANFFSRRFKPPAFR